MPGPKRKGCGAETHSAADSSSRMVLKKASLGHSLVEAAMFMQLPSGLAPTRAAIVHAVTIAQALQMRKVCALNMGHDKISKCFGSFTKLC